MLKENIRILRNSIKKIMPKRVRITGNFCKYGRIYSNSEVKSQSGSIMIIPIGGNKNENWKP